MLWYNTNQIPYGKTLFCVFDNDNYIFDNIDAFKFSYLYYEEAIKICEKYAISKGNCNFQWIHSLKHCKRLHEVLQKPCSQKCMYL